MQPIDATEGLDVIYRDEPWSIWSAGSRATTVWLVRPDPAGDESGGAPMEQIEVLLADCERAPLPPADYDEPMFEMAP